MTYQDNYREKNLMQDYPAAHSMDTNWFAIDADGQIAMFDSSEGGAVPRSNRKVWEAMQVEYLDDFLLEIAQRNKNRLISFDIPGSAVIERWSLNKQDHKKTLDWDAITSDEAQIFSERPYVFPFEPPKNNNAFFSDGWLLMLANHEVIAQLGIEQWQDNYAVRFAGDPLVVFVKKCNPQNLQILFDQSLILAGKALRNYRDGLATLFGLFVYSQDSGSPLPYTCIGQPLVPLRLEDLPEHLQDAVSWNWFDRLRFDESELIQPLEHMPCDTWGKSGWWIDTQ